MCQLKIEKDLYIIQILNLANMKCNVRERKGVKTMNQMQNSKVLTRGFLYRQRFGYGLGDFACNLIWQVISLYLLYFYTDVVHLDAKAIAAMFVVCRVIDAITDVLVGFAIDKTRTKWGKSRPWFLFGAIPFAISAFLAFSVPDISPDGKLAYAYVTYIFLSFMYTVVNIPLASILPTLTDDMNERTVLATWRKFLAFLGSSIVSATALTLVEVTGRGQEALGFRIVMGMFGVVGCVCFFLTFFLVRENNLQENVKSATLKETIHSLGQNTPWKLFALNIMFMWTGYFLQSSALVYYYKYYIGSTAMASLVATIMTMIPMVANLTVPFLAKRLGKRNLYSSAASVQLLGLIVILAGGYHTGIIVTGAVISACGYGVKESIYFSMQADPVDYGEWKTGIQATGTLSSLNGFLGKVAQAAAGIGSMLGSGIIIGLSATITVWQSGLGLSDGQVGILSGALTFAIAAGSLLAGNITKMLGLIRSFNYLNLLYAVGALICVLSENFPVLLAGLILAGFASGADLPISLTVISHDAPDEKTSAGLVASTQVFWQIGVLASYLMAFIVSRTEGALGARIVFGLLGGFAAIAFLWRTFSPKFKEFHEAGNRYRAAEGETASEEISFTKLFKGKESKKFISFFVCIMIFYICWNLLANTFGQFQTYILVKANASQSLATGCGIILNIAGLICGILFASAAGSKHRNKFFYVGIVIQAAAMVGIALGGGSVFMIVIMIACYNIGNQFAGESIYKVWTQESFPVSARASMQGFINGFSRFCCGLFALITPILVAPERIQMTMYGFAGIVIISAIAGSCMLKLQKKHGIGQME